MTYTPRIYMVDDFDRFFGKAVIYVQWEEDNYDRITRHAIAVSEDTDVIALAHEMLRQGEFTEKEGCVDDSSCLCQRCLNIARRRDNEAEQEIEDAAGCGRDRIDNEIAALEALED